MKKNKLTPSSLPQEYVAPSIKAHTFEMEEGFAVGSDPIVSVYDLEEKESWIDEAEQGNDAIW